MPLHKKAQRKLAKAIHGHVDMTARQQAIIDAKAELLQLAINARNFAQLEEDTGLQDSDTKWQIEYHKALAEAYCKALKAI